MGAAFFRKFAVIVSLWIAGVSGARADNLYLLAHPISQETRLTGTHSSLLIFADAAYEFGKAGLVYAATHSPHASMIAMANGFMATPIAFYFNQTRFPAIVAGFKRRKDFQELANQTQIRTIRSVTGGRWERKDLWRGTYFSDSMILVETDGTAPEKFRDTDWIQVEDVDKAKLRLQLFIGDSPRGTLTEIPLRAVFEGAALPSRVISDWADEIHQWQRSLPKKKRWNPLSGMDDALRVEAQLQVNDQTFELGATARSKNVREMTGTGFKQELVDAFKLGVFLDPSPTVVEMKSTNAEVLPQGTGKLLTSYKRITGAAYERRPPGESSCSFNKIRNAIYRSYQRLVDLP